MIKAITAALFASAIGSVALAQSNIDDLVTETINLEKQA